MSGAATHTDPLQASYTLLHDAISEATPAAVDMFENQLADLRELARQTRTLLRAIEQAEDALYAAIGELRDAPSDGPLRGRRLTAAAEQVLREANGDGMHYRDIFETLRSSGQRVGGKDALATLLTALTRSAHVRRVGGPRSGVYGIRAA